MRKAIALAVLLFPIAAFAQQSSGVHKFGRNDPLDMRGAKIYDSTKAVQFGTAAATTHSLTAADAICGGKYEVDGAAFFDSTAAFASTIAVTGVATLSGGATNESGVVKDARLSNTVGVNLNTTSKSTLYTCPAAKKCYVTKVVLKNASGTSGTAACGVGWDASGINVIASATHAVTATTYMPLATAAVPVFGNAADVLGIKCATPEGSAFTADVDVFGYAE